MRFVLGLLRGLTHSTILIQFRSAPSYFILHTGHLSDRQRVLLQRPAQQGQSVQVVVFHDRFGEAYSGNEFQNSYHEAGNGLESDASHSRAVSD